MSQLSEQIRILVDSFPASFSELARRTGIDRSTLYKIIGGKRLPTHQQFQALLAVCHTTQPQQRELFRLYQSATTDSVTQERNIHLLALLKALLCGTPPPILKNLLFQAKHQSILHFLY